MVEGAIRFCALGGLSCATFGMSALPVSRNASAWTRQTLFPNFDCASSEVSRGWAQLRRRVLKELWRAKKLDYSRSRTPFHSGPFPVSA